MVAQWNGDAGIVEQWNSDGGTEMVEQWNSGQWWWNSGTLEQRLWNNDTGRVEQR